MPPVCSTPGCSGGGHQRFFGQGRQGAAAAAGHHRVGPEVRQQPVVRTHVEGSRLLDHRRGKSCHLCRLSPFAGREYRPGFRHPGQSTRRRGDLPAHSQLFPVSHAGSPRRALDPNAGSRSAARNLPAGKDAAQCSQPSVSARSVSGGAFHFPAPGRTRKRSQHHRSLEGRPRDRPVRHVQGPARLGQAGMVLSAAARLALGDRQIAG